MGLTVLMPIKPQPDTSISQQRFSPAKINLFLHITGKRADGYHNLQTVFRLLNWGDTLNFRLTEAQFNPHKAIDDNNLPIQLNINNDVKLTDSPLDNLIIKAAFKLIDALSDDYRIRRLPETLPIIAVDLTKIIPTGAGLGGGSSNAATTLLALNELWQLNLDTKTLISIGSSVGADVPIFIKGVDCIAEGIGEILTPITLAPCKYLLLTPDAHINTATLFAHSNLRRDMNRLDINFIYMDKHNYAYQLHNPYLNVFEPVVTTVSKPVNDALQFLRGMESITESTARMTGTGSCVLLPYQDNHESQLKALCKNVPCPAYFVANL